MDASLMTRMKELEDENRRLKKMYAEERLKSDVIQETMAKKWWRLLSKLLNLKIIKFDTHFIKSDTHYLDSNWKCTT